ncbi:hypothetical protein BH23BAC1_BH23BAC1_13660 [soil metagenome]
MWGMLKPIFKIIGTFLFNFKSILFINNLKLITEANNKLAFRLLRFF